MQPEIIEKHAAIAALCRRYGIARLEAFGSAARGTDFDTARSDIDFLVTFIPAADKDLAGFADFKEGLEKLFERRVDLVDRKAIETSRNYIRRRAILEQAEPVYG